MVEGVCEKIKRTAAITPEKTMNNSGGERDDFSSSEIDAIALSTDK